MNEFKLKAEEVTTPLWEKLENRLNDLIIMARKENDHLITEQRTVYLRGKIAAYKELLAAGDQDDI